MIGWLQMGKDWLVIINRQSLMVVARYPQPFWGKFGVILFSTSRSLLTKYLRRCYQVNGGNEVDDDNHADVIIF